MSSTNWIIDLTLLGLISLSIATWSIAIYKYRNQRQDARQSKQFLEDYVPARTWEKRFEIIKQSKGSFARLAESGYSICNELISEEGQSASHHELQEILEREMRKQHQLLNRKRERGLAELASIGSTAPFIGLFGTVWGIMNALKTISATGQASIDVVAGPIGEALIATAVGIITAIPAVLTYNYFMRQQRVQNTDMDNFVEGFVRFAMRNQDRWSEKC